MDKCRCIIVEDEPLAMERTKSYVEKVPFLQLCATFDNALVAMAWLKENKTDLVFLDINMDELSGIDLLESVKIDAKVIFTTAYQEYALKGYELQVADYLLKPFTFNRFLQAVNKVQESLPKAFSEVVPPDYLFIKTENRLEKILLSDIVYIEGMRDYRRIHTVGKQIMTLQNFKELEQLIPPSVICRVHKSYMVSVGKIESIERNRIRIGNLIIPISDSYSAFFYTLIKANL